MRKWDHLKNTFLFRTWCHCLVPFFPPLRKFSAMAVTLLGRVHCTLVICVICASELVGSLEATSSPVSSPRSGVFLARKCWEIRHAGPGLLECMIGPGSPWPLRVGGRIWKWSAFYCPDTFIGQGSWPMEEEAEALCGTRFCFPVEVKRVELHPREELNRPQAPTVIFLQFFDGIYILLQYDSEVLRGIGS